MINKHKQMLNKQLRNVNKLLKKSKQIVEINQNMERNIYKLLKK